MKYLMLLTICALFSVSLMAQNKVQVTGVVTGNDGLPLPGVGVVGKALHTAYQPTLMENTKFR